MYTFQGKRNKRGSRVKNTILIILIVLLAVALGVVSFMWQRANRANSLVETALLDRAISEAGYADAAIKSLTTSSGTNTNALLSEVRSHVYALQSLNMLAGNIYGPGTMVADSGLLDQCMELLNTAERRLQAGSVISEQTSTIRNLIAEILGAFNSSI